ncbi:hypothetical protein BGX27_003293 [Mortierella sp. AM989]|nr:hypothetical protein BGX27_003293 [Mortierella sp. AM989]
MLAHQRYTRMVKNSDIDENTKKILLSRFETWKVDHATEFWVNRRIKFSQIRTAATLVEGSEPYADQYIHKNATQTRNAMANSKNTPTSSSSSSNTNSEYQQTQQLTTTEHIPNSGRNNSLIDKHRALPASLPIECSLPIRRTEEDQSQGEETQKTSLTSLLRRSRLPHLRPLKPPQASRLKSTGMPSVPPFVPMSVHPAGSKRKNFDAYDKHQARQKTQKTPAGQKAQTVVPEAPPISDSSSELSPWSLTPSCLSTQPPPNHDRGRNSSISSDSGLEAKLCVDPASFTFHKYILNGHTVGQIFHRYQVAATKTVNDFDVSASLKNISHFMAMNYILVTTEELEGISTEVLEDIRHRFVWNATRLDIPTVELCGRLDQQLALGDDIYDDTKEPELRRIVILYQMVALKLPLGFNQFDNGLEDTYCHQVIDALFAYQFPTRSRKFAIDWANGEAHGSKKRRGHGYRPDGVITRNGRQIGFLEVKPPGSCHTVKEYLHDYWNLSNFAKDAIDDFLRQGLTITKVAAVQVFKHQLSLYTMEYVNGVYHWSRSCVAYLPRDQQDSGLASCVRLLNTLEMFLNTIDTNLLPRTPPRIEYGEGSAQPDYGRPSKITPSKRNNMF